MDRAQVWYAIGVYVGDLWHGDDAVHTGVVPAPDTVRVQDHSIHIETVTCEDVDLWASYIGLPKPWIIANRSYGTVEFYPDGQGWLGASIVTVSCEKPSEVDRMKEERSDWEEGVRAGT